MHPDWHEEAAPCFHMHSDHIVPIRDPLVLLVLLLYDPDLLVALPTPIERAPVERTPIEKLPIKRFAIQRAPAETSPIEMHPTETTALERAPTERALLRWPL